MNEIKYDNIIKLTEICQVDLTNKYIKEGWVLLKIFGEDPPKYILGWDKSKGDTPVIPKDDPSHYRVCTIIE